MNIQYISGFFDADGSITMTRSRKTAKYRTIKIDFSNTERSILVAIQVWLKDNGITSSISTKPARKSTHSISYTLSINTNQNCLKLCRLLRSFHPRKLQRINTVLRYHDTVTLRNGKYNDKQRLRRLAYERLFFFPSFH
jgi:hypothetical protein